MPGFHIKNTNHIHRNGDEHNIAKRKYFLRNKKKNVCKGGNRKKSQQPKNKRIYCVVVEVEDLAKQQKEMNAFSFWESDGMCDDDGHPIPNESEPRDCVRTRATERMERAHTHLKTTKQKQNKKQMKSK